MNRYEVRYWIVFMIYSSLLFGDIQFNEHLIDDNIGGSGSIFGRDIDNDGDIDLVVASIEDNSVLLYVNEGGYPINWTKIIIDSFVFGARSVHINDFNSDGMLDIVAASYTGSRSIIWWKNNSNDNSSWTRYNVSENIQNVHEVFSIDIDKDGDIDVLGASSDDNTVAIWYNDGGDPIVWSRQTLSTVELLAKSVHAGDLNNDGHIDIISAALQSNDITWWENSGGSPISWEKHIIDGNFPGAHRVEAVDIDSDGDLDVLGAGYTGHQICWWRNDGGMPISWTKQLIATSFTNACVATAIDLDNDEDLDILATGQGISQIAYWENTNEAVLNWPKFIVANDFPRPWPIFAVDIDQDNDNDIIVASSHSGGRLLKYWENTTSLNVIEKNGRLESFVVLKNYPNPFNPNTTIKFFLPLQSNVDIDIYNNLGVKVDQLAIGELEEGEHRINWNSNNLPAGIYFCKLNTNFGDNVIKMLLLN